MPPNFSFTANEIWAVADLLRGDCRGTLHAPRHRASDHGGRHLLENDLVEAIVALPTDMFYNTGIATYV